MDSSRGGRPADYRLDARYRHIERFLGQLSRLLPDGCRDDLVAEARRHLFDATEAALGRGYTASEAQREALRTFGSASQIALAAWRTHGLPRPRWAGLRARLFGQAPKGGITP